jgi:hypothetical protein|tara:strand:+ start:2752 stop:3297 length:546 start_codon:yes stop_codon:yes gene_type:complete
MLRFKTKLSLITVILLTGCASTIGFNFSVGSEESVAKGITYNYDKFEKQGWLTTEMYLLSKQSPSVTIKYRSLYENNKQSFIQLYGRMGNSDWCFLDSAYDENGRKYNFNKIDTEVSSGAGVVAVFEYFALDLTLEQLKRFSDKGIEFKVSGKRCDAKFTLDKKISSAFLNAITKRETHKT